MGASSRSPSPMTMVPRSEEHTSELQSLTNLVCRLLLEKKKKTKMLHHHIVQHPNPKPPQPHCPVRTSCVTLCGEESYLVVAVMNFVVLFFFFFLIIGRPPKSTLFPYTPLFQSDDYHVLTEQTAPTVEGDVTKPPPKSW